MEQFLERINKAPNSLKFGGLAGLVVLATLGCYFWLIQGVEDTIANTVAQQRAEDSKLAEKKEIADNLNERRREMDQLEQKLQDALTELPEKKDIDELLAQLNDVGKKAGLEIAKVTPGSEAKDAFYSRIPIAMAVNGNYHEIAIFLQEIANMRRIVNVNNIKMSIAGMKGDKVLLSSEFLATTFRFQEQAKPKKK
jgi:type IV pilus assembly protein PilO